MGSALCLLVWYMVLMVLIHFLIDVGIINIEEINWYFFIISDDVFLT